MSLFPDNTMRTGMMIVNMKDCSSVQQDYKYESA